MVVDFHIYVQLCHHLKFNPNNLTFFREGEQKPPMPPGDGDYMQENIKIYKNKQT